MCIWRHNVIYPNWFLDLWLYLVTTCYLPCWNYFWNYVCTWGTTLLYIIYWSGFWNCVHVCKHISWYILYWNGFETLCTYPHIALYYLMKQLLEQCLYLQSERDISLTEVFWTCVYTQSQRDKPLSEMHFGTVSTCSYNMVYPWLKWLLELYLHVKSHRDIYTPPTEMNFGSVCQQTALCVESCVSLINLVLKSFNRGAYILKCS